MQNTNSINNTQNHALILSVDTTEQVRLRNLYEEAESLWRNEIAKNDVSFGFIIVGFSGLIIAWLIWLMTELDLSIFVYVLFAIMLLGFVLSGKRDAKLAKYYDAQNALKRNFYSEEQKNIARLQKIIDDYFKLKVNDKESIIQFSRMLEEVSAIHFESESLNLGQYKKYMNPKPTVKGNKLSESPTPLEAYFPGQNPVQKGIHTKILPPESFFSFPRKIDWDELNKIRKYNGDLGEMFVYDLEVNYLNKIGRSDLAEKVQHVAIEGDGHGYDIKSFYENGSEKFIEVKATNTSSGSTFNMSKNEFNFLQTHLNNAVVYHVHNVNNERETTVVIYPASSVVNSPDISPSGYVVKM
jgi:uncharacterized protein (UPF0333 family)